MKGRGGKGVIEQARVLGLVGAMNSIMQSLLRDPRVDGLIVAVESGAREHESLLALFTNLVSQHKQLLAHVQAPSGGGGKRPRLEQIRDVVEGTAHLHGCLGRRKCTCMAQVRALIQPREVSEEEEEDSPDDAPLEPEIVHDATCPPGIKGKCVCRLRSVLSRFSKSPRVLPPPPPPSVPGQRTFTNWDIGMALSNILRSAKRKKFDRQDPLMKRMISVGFEFERKEETFSMMLDEIPVDAGVACSACGGALHGTGVKAASCTNCVFHPVCAAAIRFQFSATDFDRCFGKLNGPQTCST